MGKSSQDAAAITLILPKVDDLDPACARQSVDDGSCVIQAAVVDQHQGGFDTGSLKLSMDGATTSVTTSASL